MLIAESEKNGIWTLQAGIFPENTASIRLHEGQGFRVLGRRERIGKLAGVWRDTDIAGAPKRGSGRLKMPPDGPRQNLEYSVSW